MLALFLLGGCCYPVRDHVDLAVDTVANRPIDLQPADASMPYERPQAPPPRDTEIGPEKRPRRLTIPHGIPGTEAPSLPERRLPLTPEAIRQNREALRKFYPELAPLGPDPEIQPGPNGTPLNLADLQRLAMSNSPLLRQAAADVEAAKGAARQAGTYPNPMMGYEADNVNSAGSAGFQGGFIDQLIKTGGKLKLSWAAAQIDLLNARLAYRRAQTDLIAQIRGQYFAVLVALESIRINKALAEFTHEAHRVQLEIVEAMPAAPYEPMALRVLANQARTNLIQARNRYTSAWKQLAANIGLPGMPRTELAGRVDMPIPVYRFDKVQTRVLSTHTDVAIAANAARRARYNLRLAQVTPIPDVDVRVVVQKDFTTAPFLVTNNVQVTMPIPVWDQNKGNIIQAQGQLMRAIEEGHRVRDALVLSLADAFERYQTNRKILELYRDQILPDQVRVYRATYERHFQVPAEVGFADVVTAQQTLASVLATYTSTLGLMWQAVVDVANVMQTNDLFQVGDEAVEVECVTPLLVLEELQRLPCCHPSSPVQGPRWKGADPAWPPAIYEPKPGQKELRMPKVDALEQETTRSPSRNPKPANHKEASAAYSDVQLLTPEHD
jgi:cobalt-zinc-cadmium efflux system outer membrane protein